MSKAKKQVVKPLTQWQEKKAIARAGLGWNQDKIARSLKVAKQRVSRVLIAKKAGKRAVPTGASAFWSDVKIVQRLRTVSWKKATKITYHEPFWGSKRAAKQGKKYKRYQDFWDEVHKQRLSEEEKEKKWQEESEEYYFDTPT